MIIDANDPEVRAALLALLSHAGKADRPRSATAFLAAQDLRNLEFAAAVDGAECRGCHASDGVVVAVLPNHLEGVPQPVPAARRIYVTLFQHGGAKHSVYFGAEQAKQLVNRLGEAIAVAERVDTEAGK